MSKMAKKILLGAIAGAFASVVLLPIASPAHAQMRADMRHDRHEVRQDRRELRNDRAAMHNDVVHHNFGAAESEQQQIRQDRSNLREERNDLHRDRWERRHHRHDID